MSARFDLDPKASRTGLRRAGHPRRRERRGRSGRGALLPPGLPAALNRHELFEDMVAESAERLVAHLGTRVERIQFIVRLIPNEAALTQREFGAAEMPLGAAVEGTRRRPPRVEVFRKPVEFFAGSPEALPWLVFDVVVELVAELLAMAPEDVHPDYRGLRGPDEE